MTCIAQHSSNFPYRERAHLRFVKFFADLLYFLVAPALAGEWLNYCQPDLLLAVVFRGSGLLIIEFIVLQFLRFIVRAPRVDFEVLCARVAFPIPLFSRSGRRRAIR